MCRRDVCMCFKSNNTVRKATDDTAAFLSSRDTWEGFRQFTV